MIKLEDIEIKKVRSPIMGESNYEASIILKEEYTIEDGDTETKAIFQNMRYTLFHKIYGDLKEKIENYIIKAGYCCDGYYAPELEKYSKELLEFIEPK